MRPSRFPASPRPLRVGESRALTLLLAALALFPLAARAQTTWTNTGDGDWLAAENWNPVAVPASSTDVVIDNGGTAILSTPPDPNQNQTDDLIVGQNGTGHLIVQSGGQLISIGNVDIGQNAGGVGTVRVAGTHSLWLLNHSLNVGPAGQGTLTVADGGKVDVGQLQILLGGLGGTATVNIGEGGAAGTLLATSVNGSGGPAAVVFNHTDALAFAPQLTGALSVTKLGAGTLTFSGATANTYSDGTTLAGGTLAIDSDDKLGGGALAFDGGTLTITQDVSMPERPISLDAGGGTFDIPLDTTLSQSGVIDGTGALTKLGAGTLVLAGENAYTGVTAANGGTLVVAGALTTGGLGVGRVASATAAVVVSGTLQVTGGSPSFITVGDKADSHGTLTIEDGGLVSLASGAKLTVGWEDATGTLNLDDGGTLQVGGTDGIQKHASGTTDFNLAGGTLQVANNPLTTSVPMTLAEDTTSTIDTHGFGATFSGALAGDGALVKTGDGTLVLAGDNTYTGATLVSAGTLAVNGSLSAGTTVTVADGATLAGSGTIAGNVIAADGSTTAPGDGLGTLTIGGDYTWTAGATLAFALSGSDDASDQLAITGALAKGGSGTFAFDFGGTGQPGTTYTLATFDSQSGFAADASDFSYTNAGGPAGTFALVDGTKLTFTTALRPILTGVSPQLGSSNGGTTVTLTGAAFVDGQTTVAFGGSAGTNVTVQSPTSLTVTAPAGSPGASVDVTVTTPHGTSATSAADRFTYIPLAVGTDAELRNAILYAAPGDTIGLTGDITLTADLPAVQAGVTIDGGGFTLDGDNIYRGFFTYSASDRITVTIANLSIRHTWALGGAGGNSDAWTTGGGGAGLGGAVFVHANVDLVLRNVTIDGSSAAGGAGGIDSNPLYAGGAYGNGGGGGLGGAGGNATALNGGGGGIGRLAVGGGNDHAAGNSTIVPGADGGAASSAYDTPSGGGGVQPSGTMGGFGGGGGSVSIGTGTAGSGGFGGGGGSGAVGGAGGFGGGGGGSYSGSAAGGFGGGNGSRFGGGGLGAGGAIFVQQGGSLTLSGPLTIDGSTVTGGAGAGAGSAFGDGLFIQGDGTITFSPNAGETQTIDDGIADQTGSGGIDSNAGAGALTKLGDGTLVLAGANTYTGATLVSAGTLTVNGSLAAETTVTIADGATLAGSGTIAGDVIAADGSTIAPGSLGTLTIGGDYTWTAGATLAFALSGSDDASNQLAITGALTKSGSGTFAFDFGGTGQPGTTYTLATFATTDFAFDASDFSYTNAGGPAGTFALVDGTQLTFTTSSNNADLSALALSAGTLSPAFARGTFGYAADVPNATDSVTVTPTLADPTASVTVNGTGVVSGTASGPIALAVGANPITVLVTAQDGTTTRTTTITVTRAAVSVTPDLPASIVFGNLHFTYDGTAKPATATTEPAGLTVAFTYNGSSTPPTDAGSYAVRARILTSGYTGSATSTLTIAPAIAAAPTATTAKLGGPATLTGDAAGGANVTYQWRRNGVDLPGATGPTLTIEHTAPGDAGLYSVVVTADGVATETESESAPLALTFTGKLAGDGMEVGTDIVHPNGNVYDQILLTGPAVSVKADPGQVTRVSYVDLSDDIVQVELAGAGTLTLSLTDASGPAEAVNYHQPDVAYMKGHATIFVSGADATTNLTIFSVGRITAVDQSLFRDDVAYDGVADVALVEIASADGTFGGLRAANAGFSEVKGWTGVHAPGVQFAGPVYVGNLRASDDATPVLLLGAVDDARIAGGDLAQDNGRPVGVSGLVKLHFVDGMTSHGVLLPAQRNAGVLEEDGADVTDRIVVNPE